MGSELGHSLHPPGSFSCRTLGSSYSSWLKPSTTSAVSSRSTPSHTRQQISGGERGCMVVLHGFGGGSYCFPSPSLTQLPFPGYQEAVPVQCSHGWQPGLLGSHHCAGPWLPCPGASSGPWASLP